MRMYPGPRKGWHPRNGRFCGRFKVEGNPFEPLTSEARDFLQSRVNEIHAQFVADVARGRNTGAAKVRATYGEGRALSAKSALAAGMVDGIATIDDAIARAASLARLTSREAGRNARADVAARAILAGI